MPGFIGVNAVIFAVDDISMVSYEEESQWISL